MLFAENRKLNSSGNLEALELSVDKAFFSQLVPNDLLPQWPAECLSLLLSSVCAANCEFFSGERYF